MLAGLRLGPAGLIAALYLVVHLPFLAASLEDIDSINFALGLREFDVARHQPHPPGYPVYIALAHASRSAIGLFDTRLEPVRAEALALAIWSAIAGAAGIVAAGALYGGLTRAGSNAGRNRFTALVATALLALSPLFWISGSRPMSDPVGLAFALAAQALLLGSLRQWWDRPPGQPLLRGEAARRTSGPEPGVGRLAERPVDGATRVAVATPIRTGCGGSAAAPSTLVLAVVLAAIAAGVRIQTVWLTLPLLATVLVLRRREIAVIGWRVVAAGAAGIAVWAVPLLVVSGGPAQYLTSLAAQAGEDFAWVDMLWANPEPRRAAFALYETFVMPWGAIPLAAVIGVAAVAGTIALLRQQPRALALMAVAFGPYALFHLLFQETRHVRYALPLLPVAAWLAAWGISAARGARPLVALAVCGAAAWVAVSGMAAYASEPHPAFRAIDDVSTAAADERPAALFAHFSLRRPLQAQPPEHVAVVDPPRTNEWIGLVDYWRNGGDGAVWFLADPQRTDLAVLDPQARRDVRRYRWRPADRLELGGARPRGVDWYRLAPPGWFVGDGWSLTPELGGMTRLAGTGPDRRPIEAFVRRRGDAMVAVVGARHLGLPSDEPVRFTLALDGRRIDQWTLEPTRGPNTLRVVDLPPGALAGTGTYARLVITAASTVAGRRTPAVAIRQFDIQPVTGLVFAFDEGWHEDELDNTSGLRWRWSSGRSVLRVVPPQDIRVTLRGESPLKYLPEPPIVRVRAGERVVAQARPAADFEWTFDVGREDVRASGGRIAIETEPVYLPGVAEGTVDTRELGLRLFTIDVVPSRRD